MTAGQPDRSQRARLIACACCVCCITKLSDTDTLTHEILYLIGSEWLQSKRVPVRGKHLDELRNIDKLCIGFSKANTSPFTYFYFRYCWIMSASGVIPWHWKQVSWTNALLPLPCLFVMFDATYCLLHYILHWQCLYGYIHKHHHIQKAPSRANIDAVNVHPVEFVLGEYNHLLAVWFWTSVLGQSLHVLAALVFVTVGGILAGINHTRYDIVLSVPVPNISGYGSRWWLLRSPTSSSSQTTTTTTSSHLPWIVPWTIYDSKAHDVHHRIPQSNYGQYTMFWDYLFGSYRCVEATQCDWDDDWRFCLVAHSANHSDVHLLLFYLHVSSFSCVDG